MRGDSGQGGSSCQTWNIGNKQVWAKLFGRNEESSRTEKESKTREKRKKPHKGRNVMR